MEQGEMFGVGKVKKLSGQVVLVDWKATVNYIDSGYNYDKQKIISEYKTWQTLGWMEYSSRSVHQVLEQE